MVVPGLERRGGYENRIHNATGNYELRSDIIREILLPVGLSASERPRMRKMLLILLLAVAACGDPKLPMALPEDDASGKMLAAPPEGMAALYVYRQRSGNTATISLGSRMVGPLQGGNWLRVDLPPGTYDVRCAQPSLGTETSELVTLGAREVVYVSAVERLTPYWACHMTRETVERARPAILAGNRIREIK